MSNGSHLSAAVHMLRMAVSVLLLLLAAYSADAFVNPPCAHYKASHHRMLDGSDIRFYNPQERVLYARRKGWWKNDESSFKTLKAYQPKTSLLSAILQWTSPASTGREDIGKLFMLPNQSSMTQDWNRRYPFIPSDVWNILWKESSRLVDQYAPRKQRRFWRKYGKNPQKSYRKAKNKVVKSLVDHSLANPTVRQGLSVVEPDKSKHRPFLMTVYQRLLDQILADVNAMVDASAMSSPSAQMDALYNEMNIVQKKHDLSWLDMQYYHWKHRPMTALIQVFLAGLAIRGCLALGLEWAPKFTEKVIRLLSSMASFLSVFWKQMGQQVRKFTR